MTDNGVTDTGEADNGKPGDDPKACLRGYLQSARDAVLLKLDGLSEYDVRRPLTRTGTNLLGLVKHLASCELVYFGDVFGRPSGITLPWFEDGAESNADMWATPGESRESIVALYRQAWAHADATFDALSLEDTGRVPWWPQDRAEAALHRIMLHMVAETHRHAGHADIVRELIDGRAGLRAPGDNVPQESPQWWVEYRDRLESAARAADKG